MANADSDEPHCHTLASLPPELIALVAEGLDACGLARFAAASTLCRAAAHSELRAALRAAVLHSLVLHLVPGALHDGSSLPRLERLARARDALVQCPYFCLPDDLVAIPPGAFRGCSYLTSPLTLPTSLTTIGDRAFEGTSLTGLTLPPPSPTSVSAPSGARRLRSSRSPPPLPLLDSGPSARAFISGRFIFQLGSRRSLIALSAAVAPWLQSPSRPTLQPSETTLSRDVARSSRFSSRPPSRASEITRFVAAPRSPHCGAFLPPSPPGTLP